MRSFTQTCRQGGHFAPLCKPKLDECYRRDDQAKRETIGFDSAADYWCVIPEWRNRFGRHYSAPALLDRVLDVAIGSGLAVEMLRLFNFDKVHLGLWLRWVLILEQRKAPN